MKRDVKYILVNALVVSVISGHAISVEGGVVSGLPSNSIDLPNLLHLAQVTGPSIGVGQTGGGGTSTGTSVDPVSGGGSNTSAPASLEATSKIALKIKEASEACGRIPDKYVVDCLARSLQSAADEIPSNPDLRSAKRTLHRAASDLRRLVRKNIDGTQPSVRVRLPETSSQLQRLTPPISPLAPEAIEAVKSEAFRIVSEAETTLLRSANSSRTRSIHYQRLAEAVGSSKLLLRS